MAASGVEVDAVAVAALEPRERYAARDGRTRTARTVSLRCKRIFDVAVAASLTVVLSPLLVLIAAAILFDTGRPVVYRQRRVGYRGRLFTMLKFRSMTVGADVEAPMLLGANVRDGLLFKVLNDPRVTRVGRFIRRTSLDELPQLWNVVRGDMSLVGPRPLPVAPGAFDPEDHRRHDVRPGITGPWQVGQHDSYRSMVTLDLDYVDAWSLSRDVALLVRTLPAVVRRRSRRPD